MVIDMHPNWSKFNKRKVYVFPGETSRWHILKRKVTEKDTFLLCQRGRGDYVTLSFMNDIDPFKMMPGDKFSSNRRGAEQRFKSVIKETLELRKVCITSHKYPI